MGAKLGLKAHRKAFDQTGKLSVSCHFTGEEARAVMEFMEQEGLDNPGAAGRTLIAAALAAYPEWAATISMRRAAVTEQRMWALARIQEMFRDLSAEAEQNFAENTVEMEIKLMDEATQRMVDGE